MTLSTTAHLPANQSSNLKSVVASEGETNMTAMLHAQPRMPCAHTATEQGTSRRYAWRNFFNKCMPDSAESRIPRPGDPPAQ